MEFGLFFQLPCAPDQSPAERYADTIAQARLADELGFDTVWVAELHFNARFSIMPAPLVLGAAIAQATKRIKIGTAVNLVPLHHPIRLAEETATLDVLSHGRAIFGIGRGSIPTHFEGYGVPLSESGDRFREALDFVLKAWTEDELTFEGQYYKAEGLRVVPKPYQRPHPPVYVASNSPQTFELVGELGHNILATPLIATTEGVRTGLQAYRNRLGASGHNPNAMKATVNLPVYVAEDSKKAREEVEATVNNYLGALTEMQEASARKAQSVVSESVAPRRSVTELTFQRVCGEYAAIGDPEACIERLKGFQELLDPQEFMCWFNIGGLLPHEKVERSMRLFAEKVMPHFR